MIVRERKKKLRDMKLSPDFIIQPSLGRNLAYIASQ